MRPISCQQYSKVNTKSASRKVACWQDWRKKILHFWEKKLKQLKGREILCVHFPKTIKVSTGLGYKIRLGRIHCLYKNVISCVYVATNQSKNERRERTLHLETSQLPLIQDPIVHWAYLHASHHGEFLREQCSCFGAQHIAQFTLMKQVALNVNSTQSATSSSGRNNIKCSWIANLFTRIVRK